MQILGGVERYRAADLLALIALDDQVLAAADLLELVPADDQITVVAYPFLGVVLDADVLVVLAMHEDLLAAGLVLEGQLVEAAGVRGRAGAENGARLVVGKRVGRHRGGVVETAGDDRLVRIAFEEFDDRLHADARDRLGAPLLARPVLRDAQEHRAVFVGLAVAVPAELDLHPAVFVGVDLLAFRAHDCRGLRPVHDRNRRVARRPEHGLGRQCDKAIRVMRRTGIGTGIAGFHRMVLHRQQGVFLALLVADRVVLQREGLAGAEARHHPLAADRVVLRLFGLDAGAGERAAGILVGVETGIIEELVLLHPRWTGDGRLIGGQIGLRLLEVVIGEHPFTGPELVGVMPAVDVLPFRARHERHLFLLARFEHTRRIAKDCLVLAVLVLEEIEDALVLQQPRHKVEVGLAVLHLVFIFLVGALSAELEIAEAVVGKDLLDDVDHVLLLEDAGIGAAGQEPQPGHDARVIDAPAAIGRLGRVKITNEAIEERPLAAARLDREGDVLADQLLVVDRVVATEHFEIELEKLRHGLVTRDPGQQEVILAERRLDRNQPFVLGEILGHAPSGWALPGLRILPQSISACNAGAVTAGAHP